MRPIFCKIINNHKWEHILKDGKREVFKCTECGKIKE